MVSGNGQGGVVKLHAPRRNDPQKRKENGRDGRRRIPSTVLFILGKSLKLQAPDEAGGCYLYCHARAPDAILKG